MQAREGVQPRWIGSCLPEIGCGNKGRMAEPTIEQIEAEIRAARFEQSEAEAFLARRSRSRLVKDRIAAAKDGTVAWAYGEGIRQGKRDAKWIGVSFGVMSLGALVLLMLLL
jgi:hypothetical protein